MSGRSVPGTISSTAHSTVLSHDGPSSPASSSSSGGGSGGLFSLSAPSGGSFPGPGLSTGSSSEPPPPGVSSVVPPPSDADPDEDEDEAAARDGVNTSAIVAARSPREASTCAA